MDYIITVFFVAMVVFWGWFYGCKMQSWCGAEPQGTPLTEVLSAAESASRQVAQRDAKSEGEHSGADSTSSEEQESDSDTTVSAKEEIESITQKKCESYFTKDIRPGAKNDKQEVIKLEKFLNKYEGEKLIAGGVYDGTDQAAVKRFQEKYRADILDPAGVKAPNGLVLEGTRAKLNALYCAQKKKEE